MIPAIVRGLAGKVRVAVDILRQRGRGQQHGLPGSAPVALEAAFAELRSKSGAGWQQHGVGAAAELARQQADMLAALGIPVGDQRFEVGGAQPGEIGGEQQQMARTGGPGLGHPGQIGSVEASGRGSDKIGALRGGECGEFAVLGHGHSRRHRRRIRQRGQRGPRHRRDQRAPRRGWQRIEARLCPGDLL